MKDQELQRIAEETSKKILDGTNDGGWITDPEVEQFILKALTQVRDAQENKIAILEANEAVQNALIVDLKNKVEIAREALVFCAGEFHSEKVAKEALEQIGGVE